MHGILANSHRCHQTWRAFGRIIQQQHNSDFTNSENWRFHQQKQPDRKNHQKKTETKQEKHIKKQKKQKNN